MENPGLIVLVVSMPLWFPVVVYLAVVAGRYAWLRAEQWFFRD